MIDKIMEQAADVLAKLAPEAAKYFDENSVHREIGGRLLAAWQTGVRESLGFPKVIRM
jgi:serine/threonine-protein kinase HipA